jgi:hypothetical protein
MEANKEVLEQFIRGWRGDSSSNDPTSTVSSKSPLPTMDASSHPRTCGTRDCETSFHRIRTLLSSDRVISVSKELLFAICSILRESTSEPCDLEKMLPLVLSHLRAWRCLTAEDKVFGLEKLALDLSECMNGLDHTSNASTTFPRLRIRWIPDESDPLDLLVNPIDCGLSGTENDQGGSVPDPQADAIPISHSRKSSQVTLVHENAAYRSGCCACRHPRHQPLSPPASPEMLSEILSTSPCPQHSQLAGPSHIAKPKEFPLTATHQSNSKAADQISHNENMPLASIPSTVVPNSVQVEDPVKPTVIKRSLPQPWPLPPTDQPLNSLSSDSALRRSTRLNAKLPRSSLSLSKPSDSSSQAKKSISRAAKTNSLSVHATHLPVPRRITNQSSKTVLASSSSYNIAALAPKGRQVLDSTTRTISPSHVVSMTNAGRLPLNTTVPNGDKRSTNRSATNQKYGKKTAVSIAQPKTDNATQRTLRSRKNQAS